MKTVRASLARNPYVVIGFSTLLTVIACVAPAVVWEWALAYLLVAIAAMVWVWRGTRALALASLLAVPMDADAQQQPQPEIGIIGVGVGVGVLCAGGYCIFKLAKFCQRKFPKTNQIAQVNAIGGYGPQYAGWFEQPWTYDCEDADAPAPTTFTMTVSPTAGILSCSALTGEQNYQSFRSYRDEWAEHGIGFTNCVALNGSPAPPGSVPLSIEDGTITCGSGGSRLVIESSPDMTRWQPVLSVRTATPFLFEDTTIRNSTFYRVRATP